MSDATEWVKASASDSGGQCVEMRRGNGWIEIRDSKDPAGPVLRFDPAEFAAWIDGAKAGEFDGLV